MSLRWKLGGLYSVFNSCCFNERKELSLYKIINLMDCAWFIRINLIEVYD